ncbi:lactadherin [Lingula anatina]|uniref:Lactadherin n=1 Tax=Lingula anatina TaxID=7574 RepID=A0A1S3HNY9_LINAN|nr:lactadherin [Lingula anatina]|eukprot:XP_013387256.1 lactadherin [Lingula anatina]
MSGSILCVATITSYTEAMTRRQLAAGTSWNLWVSQKNSVSVPDIQQCQNLLVSGNNPIPDSHITASSSFAMFGFTPQHSRLTNDASSGTLGGWAVDGGSINTNQWLQFDLGSKHVITAVVTKGRALDGHNHYQWVTSYKLHFSSDAVTWTTYQTECGSDVVFQGNTDTNTLKQNTLQGLNKMMPVIFARYVRINPQTFHNYPTMRGDVLGCVLGT